MNEPRDALRLFVAIELPAAVLRMLAATADSLRGAAGDSVRWVRPEGIHLTLKFLGATPPDRVPAIEAALTAACIATQPFELRAEGAGSFGGRRNVRVVWVGVGGDTVALTTLARGIVDALAPLGFERERRPLAAHLTLGRVRDDAPQPERERLYDVLSRIDAPPSPVFRVDHISLMRSTLQRGGAVYDALATFPLAAP